MKLSATVSDWAEKRPRKRQNIRLNVTFSFRMQATELFVALFYLRRSLVSARGDNATELGGKSNSEGLVAAMADVVYLLSAQP